MTTPETWQINEVPSGARAPAPAAIDSGMSGSIALRSLLGGLLVAIGVLALSGPAWAASPSAVAWGENEVGQLGNGTTANGAVPSAISGLSGVSALAGGRRHSLALLSDGTVSAWGENEWGQLGDGTHTGPSTCHAGFAAGSGYMVGCSTRPVAVGGLSGVVAIAAGAQHSLALLSDGTVMAWGDNESGQLGDGTTSGPEHCYTEAEPTQCSMSPVPVGGLSEVIAIAAGQNYSLALLKNGTVMAWGSNGMGELGDGSSGWANDVPAPVTGLSGVTAIAAGGDTSLALLSNGTVMSWGANEFGQLGDGSLTQSDVPVAVSGLSGVSSIAVGAASLALLDDGTVMAWGSNISGQLGDGTNMAPSECFPLNFCSTTPIAVSDLEHVTAIAAGGGQSLALLSDGTVMAWGLNWDGQLGDGTEKSSYAPTTVIGLGHVTVIAGGADFTLAYGVPSQLPPRITEVAPNSGPASGGTSVTIAGSNFAEVTTVDFGSTAAASYVVSSETSITAVAPTGTGTVDVTVTTAGGDSPTGPADLFTYGPTSTPAGSAEPRLVSSLRKKLTPKVLTRAQKLSKALKACEKHKSRRATCARLAKAKYATSDQQASRKRRKN
jgi:alpha-tubulin suppressor-like RCC1 family protein